MSIKHELVTSKGMFLPVKVKISGKLFRFQAVRSARVCTAWLTEVALEEAAPLKKAGNL